MPGASRHDTFGCRSARPPPKRTHASERVSNASQLTCCDPVRPNAGLDSPAKEVPASEMIRVTGYEGGVAYTVEMNPTVQDGPLNRGIITHASPLGVLVHVTEQVGEIVPGTATGPDVEVSLTNALSIVAALHQGTEVVAVTGRVPGYPQPEDDVNHDAARLSLRGTAGQE